MKKINFLRSMAAVALMTTVAAAQAHTGHGVEGFVAGIVHPFLGLDHLLAMVAVGIWSVVMLPKGQRLAGPALFMAMLLAGALVALTGFVLPQAEPGVAASVVALGSLLLLARRIGLTTGLALISVAALLHGYAHGAELAAGQSFASYAAGFMLGSAALHGVGLAAGNALQHLPTWVGRAAAVLMGTSGLVMLAARL